MAAVAGTLGWPSLAAGRRGDWWEIVFGFEPTPEILVKAMVLAGVMGSSAGSCLPSAPLASGPAELIVLVADVGSGAKGSPPSPIGLFKDEPELVDEIMDHARDIRAQSRMRAAP